MIEISEEMNDKIFELWDILSAKGEDGTITREEKGIREVLAIIISEDVADMEELIGNS